MTVSRARIAASGDRGHRHHRRVHRVDRDVMYRSNLGAKDRSGAIFAVVAIHAALLLALLHISGKLPLDNPQSVLRVFDIIALKPSSPSPPPQQKTQPKPRAKEGGSAPKNIKSEATPVVAPAPKIPSPPTIAATETPRQGTAPTQGASTVRGPGTGAGGVGTGTGSGSGGNGPGGGGENGVAYRARLLTPTLRGRDFPRSLLETVRRGARVDVGLRIEANGTVSECRIFRSSGVPALDSEVCNLAHERFRYRPALNRLGQPVASWTGYSQADF
jgi:periplasmic protein TonB